MTDLRSLVNILPFLSKIYENNQSKGARDYDLCHRYAKLTQIMVLGIPIMYFAMEFLYQASKYVIYCTTGVLEPTMGMYFPRPDGYEEFGEVFTHFFNLLTGLVCILVISSTDPLIFFIFANLTMIPSVIKIDLLELKILLEKPLTIQHQITSKLVQIIQMHRSYNE